MIFILCVFVCVSGDHKQKFYWGHKEILLPVYKNMADAMKKHPDVDVLINFASLRSAFDSTMETMQYPQVKSYIFYFLIKEWHPAMIVSEACTESHQFIATLHI